MTKHEAIERLLQAVTSRRWAAGAAFGGAAAMNASVNVLQSDMNKAIAVWLERDDPEGIRQVTDTLRIVGGLTDNDYEQIMKAIDGDT